ncbi:SOCS box domain-containing protein [Trichonephila clavipes]|nr:SOCS box domain-containing protein [Trichonephila clavipes]
MGSIVLWDSSPDPSLPMDNVGKILLLTAADIVRYSFIVRKSLTYLDLSICEYSNGEKLCFTKDELKNLFLSKRYVTYFYHLDVPWRLDDVNGCSKFGYNYRDYSLYCFQQPVLVVDGIIHKISMKPHIETAVQKTNNKIRALMKFSKFLSFQELDLSENFIDYLKLISEEKDDSDLVCQFLQIQPQLVGRVFFSHYDQHLVDFILYHCTLAQFRFFEGHTRISWEHCMYYRHYESFYYLIKYGYSYPFFEEDFLDCLRGVAQLHL